MFTNDVVSFEQPGPGDQKLIFDYSGIAFVETVLMSGQNLCFLFCQFLVKRRL